MPFNFGAVAEDVLIVH